MIWNVPDFLADYWLCLSGMVWHAIKPGLTTPLDLFCPAPVQSRDNTAIGLIYTIALSVLLSCVHVYFFLVVACFENFCFQVHSFQLKAFLLPLMGKNMSFFRLGLQFGKDNYKIPQVKGLTSKTGNDAKLPILVVRDVTNNVGCKHLG